MQKFLVLLVTLFSLTGTAYAATTSDGMVSVPSQFDVAQTTAKLEQVLQAKGMKVFAVIDHSAGAKAAGMDLKPTKLVLFGNPKVGTPLMQCQQSIALDLPQKALIWEDQQGVTRLSYNAPFYLQERHQVEGCSAVFEKVSKALAAFAKAATQAP